MLALEGRSEDEGERPADPAMARLMSERSDESCPTGGRLTAELSVRGFAGLSASLQCCNTCTEFGADWRLSQISTLLSFLAEPPVHQCCREKVGGQNRQVHVPLTFQAKHERQGGG